jgi:ATP-dependent DNA helicase RecG
MPPGQAVRRLAAEPESQWFERKSGRISARDLAVPLVAMANAEGGTIAVGLSRGSADGVAAQRANELRQAAADFTEPAVSVHVAELGIPDRVDGRVVMIITVAPGSRVHQTTSGDCYLRIGDESRKLGFVDRQELEYDRGNSSFDGTAADAALADLDPAQVRSYQTLIGASSPERALTARNLITDTGGPTVAAWLLFAERPQRTFPSAHVRILQYADIDRGTGSSMSLLEDHDVRCEGSIPHQLDDAAQVIEKWLPRVRALAASGRFEPRPIIPKEAWLEGLVNAVLHRSYSLAGDHIRVELFPDRIEISNPGRFPGHADPNHPDTLVRSARNPRIARVCADLGNARELGEGILRMFAAMRSAGLTAPVYQQFSSAVRLVLSAARAVPDDTAAKLGEGAHKVLDLLRSAGEPLRTGDVETLAGVTRPTALRYLRALRDAGLITWQGESARDPQAKWRLT